MQKRLVDAREQRSVTEESWLDLEAMAEVELTSSHGPWAPLPTTVDPKALGDGSVFRPIQADAVSETPFNIDIAIDPSGNFALSWIATSGPIHFVRARRFNAAGVPQGGDIDLGKIAGASPSLAFGGDGSLVVSWWSQTPDNLVDLAVQRFSAAGLPEGLPVYLNGNGDFVTRPAVGVDAQGNFNVAWNQGQGTIHDIALRRFTVDQAPTVTVPPPDITVAQSSADSIVNLYAAFADDRDANSAMTY